MRVILEHSAASDRIIFPTHPRIPNSWDRPPQWRHQPPLLEHGPLLQNAKTQLLQYSIYPPENSYRETEVSQSEIDFKSKIDPVLLAFDAENTPSMPLLTTSYHPPSSVSYNAVQFVTLESPRVPLRAVTSHVPPMLQELQPQSEVCNQQPHVHTPPPAVPTDISGPSSAGHAKGLRRNPARSGRPHSVHPYRRPSGTPEPQLPCDRTILTGSTKGQPSHPYMSFAHPPNGFWELVSPASCSCPHIAVSSDGSLMADPFEDYSVYRKAVLASYPNIPGLRHRNGLCSDNVNLSLDVTGSQMNCPKPGCTFKFSPRKTDSWRHLMTHMNFIYVCCGKQVIERDSSGKYVLRFEGGCGKAFSRGDALQRHARNSQPCELPEFMLPIRLANPANES